MATQYNTTIITSNYLYCIIIITVVVIII